jgi:DNA polymerase (family 10)
MQNSFYAGIFEEMADLLEIQGANSFRVRAYRNAARALENLTEAVEDLAAAGGTAALSLLPGIGKDLAEKLVQLIETGTFPQLEELRAEVPLGVREMLRLPGLGPKKVSTLFHELQVTSLSALQQAAEQGQISALKGFGKKTEQAILAGIQQLATHGQRVSIGTALPAAEVLQADLQQVEGVQRVEIAGSCRRRRETCGDLDLLAIAPDSGPVMDQLATHPLVAEVLQRGETKQRVRLQNGLELDLRVVPEESFGAAWQYFTGSKEHNIEIRRRAQERGLKLNEYGLFRDEQYVAGRTEEELYAAVGLAWIPPELRENRGEIARAERGPLPPLVDLPDIRGDLHMHTTATDGTASIREMAEAAKARGLEYIAITDHSQRVSVANGLDGKRLRAHWKEIDRVRGQVSGIEILCGVECDILEDATLDLPDDVLAEADWVIAVLHYGLRQPREQIMERLLNAIRNPHVHAIGHPSGRMVLRRPGAEIDYPELFRAAAEYGVLLEINANPARLDLDDLQAAAARELGIPMVINTDAHSVDGLDVMRYGVYQARRAGLEPQHVANTLPLEQFRRLLRQ